MPVTIPLDWPPEIIYGIFTFGIANIIYWGYEAGKAFWIFLHTYDTGF